MSGLPQGDAEAAIVIAGLVVGRVSTANSDTVPAGDVISQDPAAGTEVTPGSAVDLVVSTGPELVTVPDVSGLPQADAEAAIVAAGLAVGTVGTANSDTVPAGDVISQDPTAGTEVTPGSAVDFLVSTGPAIADLELFLDKNVVNAPNSAIFAVIFYDAAGNVLDPAPVPDCEVIADLDASSGSIPVIVSSAIVTFEDTRGVYSLVCTEPNSGLSDADGLVILPPATNDTGDTTQSGLYGGLGAALGETNLLAMLLEDAIFDGAVGDVPALLAELRAVRDTVDLATLQRSTAFAPEIGFLPTPNELALAGFVPGPDDAAYEAALDALMANFEETAALLAGIADFPSAPDAVSDAFVRLNDEAEALAAQFELFDPSLHGLVSLKGKINLFLAMTVPAQLHAWINAYDQALQDFDLAHNALASPFQYAAFGNSAQAIKEARLIPAVFAPSLPLPEGLGKGSEIQPAFFSLTDVSVAMRIRIEIVNRVYVPVMVHIAKSVVLLEINGLLQAYINDATLLGIQTGGLLTLHTFKFPGSAIEGSALIPSRRGTTCC